MMTAHIAWPVDPVVLGRFDEESQVYWVTDGVGQRFGIQRVDGEMLLLTEDGRSVPIPDDPSKRTWIEKRSLEMKAQVESYYETDGVAALAMARWKLSRIRDAHGAGNAGPGGITIGYCPECQYAWPCPTYRMAAGFIDPVSGAWECADSYLEPDDAPWGDEGIEVDS